MKEGDDGMMADDDVMKNMFQLSADGFLMSYRNCVCDGQNGVGLFLSLLVF